VAIFAGTAPSLTEKTEKTNYAEFFQSVGYQHVPYLHCPQSGTTLPLSRSHAGAVILLHCPLTQQLTMKSALA
jgi:hypothetical protein